MSSGELATHDAEALKQRRLPLVPRILLFVVGAVAAFFFAVIAYGVFAEVVGWGPWAAGWAAVIAGLLFGTVCLWPFAWARQRKYGSPWKYRVPLPVRVFVVLCASVLPLAATITLGVWLRQVAGWSDTVVAIVATVALVVLYTVAAVVGSLLCEPVNAPSGPIPATGPRPGDPLLAEDVVKVTGRQVLTLTREFEDENDPPDQSRRDGDWHLHFDLGDGRWVACFVCDAGEPDRELLDWDLEANDTLFRREPIHTLEREMYAFVEDDGSEWIWTQLDERWIVQIRSSDHFGQDVTTALTQATVDRIRSGAGRRL